MENKVYSNLYQPVNNNKSKFSSYLKGENHYIALIGAPFSGGQTKGGTEEGPKLFREKDRRFAEVVDFEIGLKMVDTGDVVLKESIDEQVKEFPKLKNAHNVSNFCKLLSNKVAEESKNGAFALTIGGDHSIAIGSISGLLNTYPDLCVVWVDAHADINSIGSSTSGNMHGMPLSFLTGVGERVDIFNWVHESCKGLDTSRIVYIGLRDLDVYEKRVIVERKIRAYWADDVERLGIDTVMKETLEYLPKNVPIHLSFDIDGLDQLEAPSTGTPVRGGLTLREGKYISENLYQSGRLIGLDLVEVNPRLGNQIDVYNTYNAAVQIILSSLGRNNKNERN
eukprot:TRINITY_DN3788_c0_g1_i1.p1 TRINITY_DN3788_c0_g1~~TRINITY_DN3788_c0_g1_i1.p1  ORF type:complete len:338 (-),score=89.10 TRINITY_DN3788_c0_g1_i1:70-1083(-)